MLELLVLIEINILFTLALIAIAIKCYDIVISYPDYSFQQTEGRVGFNKIFDRFQYWWLSELKGNVDRA